MMMQYVSYPLSLRNVEDLLHARGIDIGDEGDVRLMEALSRSPAVSRHADDHHTLGPASSPCSATNG